MPENDKVISEFEAQLQDLAPEVIQNLRELEGCEKVDNESIRKWLDVDKDLPGYEVLSDVDIIQAVTDEFVLLNDKEEDEELVPPCKINHSTALNHAESLPCYIEHQEESTLAEKLVLRNICSTIRKKVTMAKSKLQFYLSSLSNKCTLIK